VALVGGNVMRPSEASVYPLALVHAARMQLSAAGPFR
jgi:hypothetical protein